MKEITEIDTQKYFVVKQEDLDDALEETGTGYFRTLLLEIEKVRKKKGKENIYPSYLVLNLDDEIDVFDLLWTMQDYNHDIIEVVPQINKRKIKVRDIAVALVNAILNAKEKP